LLKGCSIENSAVETDWGGEYQKLNSLPLATTLLTILPAEDTTTDANTSAGLGQVKVMGHKLDRQATGPQEKTRGLASPISCFAGPEWTKLPDGAHYPSLIIVYLFTVS